ncbi:CLUMA_CG016023, isoform A [Clunio marinus]|uniref:CLUMA_CG016023, isoform A n=1 Tax=Clunio marinus TaxID=568069 RepID=A0A1J1IQT6_9DIPT|nr:CLUMA_CG016023, isoform A [Clunio marinus]
MFLWWISRSREQSLHEKELSLSSLPQDFFLNSSTRHEQFILLFISCSRDREISHVHQTTPHNLNTIPILNVVEYYSQAGVE